MFKKVWCKIKCENFIKYCIKNKITKRNQNLIENPQAEIKWSNQPVNNGEQGLKLEKLLGRMKMKFLFAIRM